MYWRTCDTKGMGKEQKAFIKRMRTLYALEEPETTVEDTLTRTMILENQANDENAIDENGNLIPAGSMQESVGARRKCSSISQYTGSGH